MAKKYILLLAEKLEKKLPLLLCVKPVSYLNDDRSLKFVEFFELLDMLGYSKVLLYVESVHPNMTKVRSTNSILFRD